MILNNSDAKDQAADVFTTSSLIHFGASAKDPCVATSSDKVRNGPTAKLVVACCILRRSYCQCLEHRNKLSPIAAAGAEEPLEETSEELFEEPFEELFAEQAEDPTEEKGSSDTLPPGVGIMLPWRDSTA
eukprot:6012500-Amphidinium_carterae.4